MNDFSTILLAVIAVIGNCGWFLNGRKHRHEVSKAKAEAAQAEFSLSKDYVREFRENIYLPLEAELQKLRQAIEKATDCAFAANCPITHELHDSKNNNNQGQRGGDSL